jgi:hypothetical protein
MTSPSPTALRCALYGLPVIALAGCPIEERDLNYGVAVTSGSASRLANGSGGDGENAGGNGTVSQGGERETPAGAPAISGAGGSAPGGSATSQAGETNISGSSTTAGSTGNASGAGGGSAGTSTTGGSAGASTDPDTGPCGDMDHNGVQDCEETLAENATFDVGVEKWSADPGVTQAWQPDDARGANGSGSLSVKFTSAVGGPTWALAAAGQCVSAWADQTFEIGARTLIPEGQSGGRAEISLAFFGNDACAASFLGTATAVSSVRVGSWQTLHAGVKMPAGTRSVLVRLAAAKPGSQASFEAHFDDILLRQK